MLESYIRSSRDAVLVPSTPSAHISDPGREARHSKWAADEHRPSTTTLPISPCMHHKRDPNPQMRRIIVEKELPSSRIQPHYLLPARSPPSQLILPSHPNLTPSGSRKCIVQSPKITSPDSHPLSQNRQNRKGISSVQGIAQSGLRKRLLKFLGGGALASLVHVRRVKADDVAVLVCHGGLLHRGAAGRLLPSLKACTSLAVSPSRHALGSVVTYRGGWRSRERRGRRER